MQHVILYFKHDIKAILPYSNAVEQMREVLVKTGIGDYVEDDMAIDGGDAEAVLRGVDADRVYEKVLPILKELPFMRGARITLVYGPLRDGHPEKSFELIF